MTILSGWPTTAMWQRQRASKSHWCEKIEICVSAPTAAWHGLAWCGMAWHGVAWRAMAATADCPSHCYCGWVSVIRCVQVYLFVCLWVASFAHFNANVGLPGSDVCRRHSLSAFAFAVASRVRARVACSFWDFGSSLCGGRWVDWGWEQLLTECVCVCAGVGVETFTVDCANTQQQQQQQAEQ